MIDITDGQPLEILLVEDSEADAELARIGLAKSDGIGDLHVVIDGDDAMRFLRNEPPFVDAPRPDLVLLDLDLPGKHGMEVLQEIRADAELEDVPVVVLTASDHPVHIASAYDNLAVAYMTKPVSFAKLTRIVPSLSTGFFAVVRGDSDQQPEHPATA